MPTVGQIIKETQGKSQRTAETPGASCFLCPILRATLPIWIYKTLNLYGFQRFLGKFIGFTPGKCIEAHKKTSGGPFQKAFQRFFKVLQRLTKLLVFPQ